MGKLWRMMAALICVLSLSVPAAFASEDIAEELGLTSETKEATEYTVEINSAVYSMLDFSDTSEYENATRGLIDAPEALELRDAEGNLVWSQAAYSFLNDYE